MLRFTAKNFGRLRDVELHDENNLSVFVGYNEAGKSFLCDALRVLLTGQARGCKGSELSLLTSHGESSWSLRLAIEGFNVSRTPTSGDTLKSIAAQLKVPPEVLPLMFSSESCGDAGSKAMRAFLDGVAAVAFDPLMHFAQDLGIRSCIETAKRAGKSSTKQIIDFCETTRAASKQPPTPIIPSCASPTDEAIKEAREIEEAAAADLAALNKEIKELDETAKGLAAVLVYLNAKAEYEKLAAAASIVDKLPNRRALQALAATKLDAFDGFIALVARTQIKGSDKMAEQILDCKTQFSNWIVDAHNRLLACPEPPSAPAVPVLAKEGEAAMNDLKALLGEFTAEAVKGLLLGTHDTRAELNTKVVAAKTTFEAATKHREQVSRERGAWDAYQKAMPEYEQAKAKALAEWQRWDLAAKHIAEAEAANSAKTGNQFTELVSEFGASILNGRKLTLDRDRGILLNNSSIDVNMSKSERWRVEVCVMAAIARTVNSPLLIIDAADILDDRNKKLFIDWVFNKITPFFKHTVITSTVRGRLEDEKPFDGIAATKFIIHQGEIQKLVKTA